MESFIHALISYEFGYWRGASGRFYQNRLTSIPVWICDHMPITVGVKLLTHSQTSTVQLLKLGNGFKYFHPTLNHGCNYLSVSGLKFIHVSKRTSKLILANNVEQAVVGMRHKPGKLKGILHSAKQPIRVCLLSMYWFYILGTVLYTLHNKTMIYNGNFVDVYILYCIIHEHLKH